jgi:uncharacterized repeat protein (TIGR02543 family)
MKRKILSVLLTVCLVITLLPTVALAAFYIPAQVTVNVDGTASGDYTVYLDEEAGKTEGWKYTLAYDGGSGSYFRSLDPSDGGPFYIYVYNGTTKIYESSSADIFYDSEDSYNFEVTVDLYSLGGANPQPEPAERWIDYLKINPAQENTDYTINGNSIEILTDTGLAWLTDNSASTYWTSAYTISLEDDLDMSAYSWTPIGSDEDPFEAAFDGNGYTVSGIYMNGNNASGLFHSVGEDGVIENLSLRGSYLRGDDDTGGIAIKNEGTIRNCSSAATVTANDNSQSAGGIAALNMGGTISNCFNTGNITAPGSNGNAGGIAGRNSSDATSAVKNCYNTGTISAGGSGGKAGGIVGSNAETIQYCYALQGCGTAEITNGTLALNCAWFADSDGSLYSTASDTTPALGYGGSSTLLASLNAWVGANPSGGFRGWETMSGENGGYPLLIPPASPGAAYAITKTSAANGSFTVKVGDAEVTQAAAGDTVDLTANPSDGYSLSSWSVYKTDNPSTTVTVTHNSFTMPSYPVTVAATFSRAASVTTSGGTTTEYANFADALAAANASEGCTLRLLANVTTAGDAVFGPGSGPAAYTFDLNGKSLTLEHMMFVQNCALEIEDSAAGGGGAVVVAEGDDSSEPAIYVESSGSLRMISGKIQSNRTGSTGEEVILNSGTVTLEGSAQIITISDTTVTNFSGGTYIGILNIGGSAILSSQNALCTIHNDSEGTVNISGGTVSGDIDSYGVLKISGGSISAGAGKVAIDNFALGQVYLSGTPTIHSGIGQSAAIRTNNAGSIWGNDNQMPEKTYFTGSPLTVSCDWSPQSVGQVIVKDMLSGKFTAVSVSAELTTAEAATAVSEVYDLKLAPLPDIVSVTTSGGDTTSYISFAAALAAANASDGSTIRPLADITLTQRADFNPGDGKSLVLDLNGKVLTFNAGNINAVNIVSGTVTIRDTAAAGGGTVRTSDTYNQNALIGVRSSASLNVTSGKIEYLNPTRGGSVTTVLNEGTATLGGAAEITAPSGSAAYNNYGGILHITGNVSLSSPDAAMYNKNGTADITAGTLTGPVGNSDGGTLDISGGTISGNVTNACGTMNISSQANINGGVENAGVLNNVGVLKISGGSISAGSGNYAIDIFEYGQVYLSSMPAIHSGSSLAAIRTNSAGSIWGNDNNTPARSYFNGTPLTVFCDWTLQSAGQVVVNDMLNGKFTAINVIAGLISSEEEIASHDGASDLKLAAAPAATYTVTYYINDGSGDIYGSPVSVTDGDTLTAPADPTRSGFTFGGWYKEAACMNAWHFTWNTVTRATSLYAKWSQNSTNNSGGGSSPAKTITVTETSSELFSDAQGSVKAEANMTSAFSKSVEVKVSDTGEDASDFGFRIGDEVYPFDISLYIKGTNTKIQPNEGYAVTISLPVPESLLDVKEQLTVIHKSDDGTVTTLTSRLTQIDGVWYLVFEAAEFSPYALVVGGAGVPWYLDADGNKVFIGFAADGKYIAPESVTVSFTQNSKSFADVPGHWAADYIGFVTEREIFLGSGDGQFSPNTGMTRAMFATVVGRLYERSYGEIEHSDAFGAGTFTDCDYDAYYGKYVDWCAENGVIKGMGGALFAPGREITRQEMAAILYRFADYLDVLPEDLDAASAASGPDMAIEYPDSDSIASWATNAALYCQTSDIITGRTGGLFAPEETASRAEVAAIVQRFVESILN